MCLSVGKMKKKGLLQWTDLLSNSIALNSIGDLETSDNYHTYNKKVINASIRKNTEECK